MNPEENEKTKEKAPEKPAGSSRLGKEAKIGMAVILLLLAVLVAVVIVRIRVGGSGEKAVAAADRDAGKQKSADRAKGDKLLKDDKLFQGFDTKPLGVAGPTVVPAKAAVSRPPKAIDADLGPWKLASDKPEVKRSSGGELPPVSPSLLMPEPSKPLPAGRHDDRASEPPSRYGPLHRGDPGGFASAGDGPSAKAALPPPGPPAGEKGRHDGPKAAPTPTMTRENPSVASAERPAPAFPEPPPSFHSDLPTPPFRDPPVRRYTVVDGDTLFNIARYELGKASRWVEIYELNRDVLGKDFNELRPGIKLVLPETDRPDVIAQPPGGTYRR